MLERFPDLFRRQARESESPAAPKKHLLTAVGLFCAAGALGGYVCLPDGQAHAASSGEAHVLGERVDGAGDVKQLALRAARAYLRTPIKIVAGPWEFNTTRAKLGARVDMASLESMLLAARDEQSPLRRLHLQERGDAPLQVPITARLEGQLAEKYLLGVRDQVSRRSRDARIDLRTGKIVPESRGLTLDVHGTLDVLAEAMFHGLSTVQARIVRGQVKHTAKDLENLDLSGVLGRFESRYNGMDQDRSYNLRTAARHVDGIVLKPGEVFDFNAIVGERSEANGFRPATVIAGGELTDGVGGGTCQIAGTLHAAVFFAGLPFLERNTHTRPSSYLKLSLDATVAYPKLNFKFQNDLAQPIAIGVTVGNGRVVTEIRGPRSVAREVSFVRRIDEVTPFTEVMRDDPELPSGVKVLSQRGVAGFRVTSFRLVRDVKAQKLVRERRSDNYPPTTQIWRVGKGAAAPAGYVPPPNDDHPEYRADEYLILTQRPGAENAEETLKREGKTGFPGWTEVAGMPQVD
jgi:vancomycin resistance protein YoaR